MESEWFDVAYINYDEAILHGRVNAGRGADGVNIEHDVRVVLTDEQKRDIEALNFKHQCERKALLRTMAASQ